MNTEEPEYAGKIIGGLIVLSLGAVGTQLALTNLGVLDDYSFSDMLSIWVLMLVWVGLSK